MKNNKGITLIELIIVMACMGTVLLFFWTVLNSSSKDAYTITDKIDVQNSVAALMNIVQQDIQEANIFNASGEGKGIVSIVNGSYVVDDEEYVLNSYKFNGGTIEYVFDEGKNAVTRKLNTGEIEEYNYIIEFSINPVTKENYGAEVRIVGSKDNDEANRTRCELNASYFTRNTY